MSKKLVEQDYIDAAELLGCEVAAVKAVAEVEALNGGFNADGTPKILFEGHWFWKFTKGKFGETNFSYPKWISKYYGLNQHTRLQSAASRDREAALKSASWGMFQIMGFNYEKAGFKTLQSFINAMYSTERDHLIAFCHFVKNSKLDKYLKDKDWAKFAYRYNGSGYAKNKYDIKLDAAYKKFKK